MSAKRPSRRYIGFHFEPLNAARKEVSAALEGAWRAVRPAPGGAPPRLLVCQRGVGILVVPTAQAPAARSALEGHPPESAVRMVPSVSSGTIAAVKRKMKVGTRSDARKA